MRHLPTGAKKYLCFYPVHNLHFNIIHVHILYDARVRKPIIFYNAPLNNLRFIGGIWFKTRFRYPLILCMWGSKLHWGQIEARTGSSRTETTKKFWFYQSGFTCQNLNKPKALLQMEKKYLNYFKVQNFTKIIILFVTLINKYKIHFIFRLHLFLNIIFQMFRLTYLMEFHCPWYCREITWDDFLNYCYFRFLNFKHFYFGFPWNGRHERLCIGYDPSISNKSVCSSLDSSANAICGALPMARL